MIRKPRGTLGWLLIAAVAIMATDAPHASGAEPATTVFIVVGAPGETEYIKTFDESAQQWKKAATTAGAKLHWIGPQSDQPTQAQTPEEPSDKTPTDKEQLKSKLASAIKDSSADIWIVLIGHGTFDGRVARFNLRGPDVSAKELDEWVSPMNRPLVVINCASSSGPYIGTLSAPNRVVVTATKSGFEQNYTRFGTHMSKAIADPDADLDKDGQTSLLEAYLMASRATADFYRLEGRLATEHALLDDNGDGMGTPADWFRGIRSTRKAKKDAAPDGRRAHQYHLIRSAREKVMPPELVARRNELELQVMELRDRKETMQQDQYFQELETLLVELAELYEQAAKSKSSAELQADLKTGSKTGSKTEPISDPDPPAAR